jgi:hypothetical protein
LGDNKLLAHAVFKTATSPTLSECPTEKLRKYTMKWLKKRLYVMYMNSTG